MSEDVMFERLPPLAPDPTRVERVAARCHQRLAVHRRRIEARRNDQAARTVAAGFALIYFAAVAIRALSVFTAF